MTSWLLNRLFTTKDQATPRFAFQGAVNWMRALSILVNEDNFSDNSLEAYYQNVQRRSLNLKADTFAYEKLLMALHNVAALRIFISATSKYDVVRSAIIAWYYSVYFASQAMISASSGAEPETHSKTAKIWYSDVVMHQSAVGPFSVSLSSLAPKDIKMAINNMRNGNTFDLNNEPKNARDAWGSVYSYLSGTADYRQWEIEKEIRRSPEFRRLNVNDFRTKAARQLRDVRLSKEKISFLSQAFRYRGKANYRDSIYLSYGDDNTRRIKQLIFDLEDVARKYLRMACLYIGHRVERQSWDDFKKDLKQESRMNADLKLLKI